MSGDSKSAHRTRVYPSSAHSDDPLLLLRGSRMPNVSGLPTTNSPLTTTQDMLKVLESPDRLRDAPLLVLLLLIISAIIGGNCLVVLAIYYERRLRTPCNYYLLSLAAADLMIGVWVIPLASVQELAQYWPLGEALCRIWVTSDVLCCTGSILSLCAIAVDRWRAVSHPMRYSQYSTGRRSCSTIVMVWTLAVAISAPPLFGWGLPEQFASAVLDAPTESSTEIISRAVLKIESTSSRPYCELDATTGYVIYSFCGSFFLPTVVMLVLYSHIYRIASVQKNKIKRDSHGVVLPITESNHEIIIVSSPSPVLQTRRSSSVHTVATNGVSPPLPGTPSPGSVPKLRIYRDRDSIVPTHSSLSSLESGKISPGNAGQRSGGRVGPVPALGVNIVQSHMKRLSGHTKAAKTLGIVMGAFLLCWSPFFIFYLLRGVCGSKCRIPKELLKICFWIGYCNSFLNPIIYPCLNRDFSQAFHNLFTRHYCRRRDMDYWATCRQRSMRIIRASRHLRVSLQDNSSSVSPPDSPYNLSSSRPSFLSTRSASLLTPTPGRHMGSRSPSRISRGSSNEEDYLTLQARSRRHSRMLSFRSMSSRGTRSSVFSTDTTKSSEAEATLGNEAAASIGHSQIQSTTYVVNSSMDDDTDLEVVPMMEDASGAPKVTYASSAGKRDRTKSMPDIFEKIEIKWLKRKAARQSQKKREETQRNKLLQEKAMTAREANCRETTDKTNMFFQNSSNGPQTTLSRTGMRRASMASGSASEFMRPRRPSLLINDTLIEDPGVLMGHGGVIGSSSGGNVDRRSIYTIEEGSRRGSGSSSHCSSRKTLSRQGSDGTQPPLSGPSSPIPKQRSDSLTVSHRGSWWWRKQYQQSQNSPSVCSSQPAQDGVSHCSAGSSARSNSNSNKSSRQTSQCGGSFYEPSPQGSNYGLERLFTAASNSGGANGTGGGTAHYGQILRERAASISHASCSDTNSSVSQSQCDMMVNMSTQTD